MENLAPQQAVLLLHYHRDAQHSYYVHTVGSCSKLCSVACISMCVGTFGSSADMICIEVLYCSNSVLYRSFYCCNSVVRVVVVVHAV